MVTVSAFYFGSRKVAVDVDLDFLGYENVISGENYLCHDIAFVSEVFEVLFSV